jgi:hypothetical protein
LPTIRRTDAAPGRADVTGGALFVAPLPRGL